MELAPLSTQQRVKASDILESGAHIVARDSADLGGSLVHSLDHRLADGGQASVTVTRPPSWGGTASQAQVQMHWYRWKDGQTDGRTDGQTDRQRMLDLPSWLVLGGG